MDKTLTGEKPTIASLLIDAEEEEEAAQVVPSLQNDIRNEKVLERGQMWTTFNPYELEPKNIIAEEEEEASQVVPSRRTTRRSATV
jgi:hypothetical protein